MYEKEVQRVKTLLDFEETEEKFNDVLEKLDTDESERCPECDEEDNKPILSMFTYEDWTDEQFDEFASLVYDTAEEICHTIIGKNIAYNNAYGWVRKACEQKYGDAGIYTETLIL